MAVSSLAVADGRDDPAEEIAHGLSDTLGVVALGGPLAMTVAGGSSTHRAGRHAADAVVGALVVTEAAKRVWRQGRPDDPAATDGFPSGHTSLAFAFATGVGDRYHEWRVPLYAWAAAVGWSRIKLHRHYLHQVAAGAVVGFGMARISRDSHDGVCDGLFFDEDGASQFLASPEAWRRPARVGDLTLWEWSRDF